MYLNHYLHIFHGPMYITQLAEHCTGIVEVRVQISFRPFSCYCLSSVHYCDYHLQLNWQLFHKII